MCLSLCLSSSSSSSFETVTIYDDEVRGTHRQKSEEGERVVEVGVEVEMSLGHLLLGRGFTSGIVVSILRHWGCQNFALWVIWIFVPALLHIMPNGHVDLWSAACPPIGCWVVLHWSFPDLVLMRAFPVSVVDWLKTSEPWTARRCPFASSCSDRVTHQKGKLDLIYDSSLIFRVWRGGFKPLSCSEPLGSYAWASLAAWRAKTYMADWWLWWNDALCFVSSKSLPGKFWELLLCLPSGTRWQHKSRTSEKALRLAILLAFSGTHLLLWKHAFMMDFHDSDLSAKTS